MTVMLEGPTVRSLCDALEGASARMAATMRRVSDPALPAVGTWTIGETAHHVADSPVYFLSVAKGSVEPERLEDVDAGNAAGLTADAERAPWVLADRMERAERDLVAYARSVEGDPTVQPFAGIHVPLSSLLAIELGELLVHGYDIAHAAGLPWHIDAGEAVLTDEGYIPLLPFALDRDKARDLKLRLELRIRGGSRHVIVIDQGALRVEPPSARRVDCHLSVEPVAYLLVIWNRIGPWRPMLQGKLLPWGRRPHRVNTFQSAVKVT